VATGQLKRTLTNHTQGTSIYAVTFSHDHRLMASADTVIILWDATTFEPIRKLEGHTAVLRDLAFSADDKTLASASEDGTFRLWDVASGNLKVTRKDHTGQVKGVAYYPDGKTIATASGDRTVRTWDAATGEPKLVMKGHNNGLEFCAVSPDGKQLFSGTGNIGEVAFWNAETGELQKIVPNAHGNEKGEGDAEVDCGEYTPDGKWAVSGSKDNTDKFWDPKTFKLVHAIRGNPGRTECMCFSPDGKQLAIGFALDKQSYITIFDLSGVKD
jgi:WD40 repeat protein